MDSFPQLSDKSIDKLKHVSTASIATLLFKRGLRNQVLQDVHPLAPRAVNMVGPAFTLRYIPAREDLNDISVFQNPNHPQRKAVEQAPAGSVMVIDSRKDARAASAGSILTLRLWARGVVGIVTDGGFRDSIGIATQDIHSYHQRPAAPTNLVLHQAIDINVPIACGDVAVWPGDIMVGDQEAVVVIPSHLVDEIASEAAEMTIFEDFVYSKVHDGASIIGLYPPTDPQVQVEFSKWRERQKPISAD